MPLLRRTKLFPGESLPSLLERLARLNYYHRMGVIGWICQDADASCTQDDVSRPNRARTFVQLARLTGLDPEQLFDACVHRFAPALTAPGKQKTFLTWPDGQPRQTVTRSIIGRRLRSPAAAQFCPMCLSESAYHRLSWIPIPSAICLQHQCLLIHCCPGCGKRVTVAEVIQKQCSACEVDLSSAPMFSVADDEPGIVSQQVIQSWLTSTSVPDLPPGYALPDQPSNAMFHLLHELCRSLLACQDDWPHLPPPLSSLSEQLQTRLDPYQVLSPHDAYHLYRAAFQGIANWPQGFYGFLDAYSQRHHETQASLIPARRLGVLWRKLTRKDWRCPEFEFVHQSLIAYLVDRHIPLSHALIDYFKNAPWFPERSGLWTKEQAARVLDISERVPDGFCYGPLGKCLVPESRSRFPLFNRNKVLAIKIQWDKGLPLADAAWWLGLEQDEVIQLTQQGELTSLSDQNGTTPENWIFERQSLVRFFEAVTSQLKLYEGHPGDLACLHTAAHVTSADGIDSLALLKGVADGILPAYRRMSSRPRLSWVYFLDSMVTTLPGLIYAQRGWISDHAFFLRTGITKRVIHEWIDSGLLEPVATFWRRHYFDLQTIEWVATEYLEQERPTTSSGHEGELLPANLRQK